MRILRSLARAAALLLAAALAHAQAGESYAAPEYAY